MANDNGYMIPKYDRLIGNLKDVALFTKPSTVKNHQTLTGQAETFIVQTARTEDLGDYIFIEAIDEATTVTRLALPPKVADAIAAQRASLTTRRRKAAAKRRAKSLTEEDKQVLRERLAKARKSTRKVKK